MPWVERTRSGFKRQDVAAHALEIVLKRVGLGSGVDHLDRAVARARAANRSCSCSGQGFSPSCKRRSEGLQLAERHDAEAVALVRRDLRPAKAGRVDPDRGVEHAARAARDQDEGELLCGSGFSMRRECRRRGSIR